VLFVVKKYKIGIDVNQKINFAMQHADTTIIGLMGINLLVLNVVKNLHNCIKIMFIVRMNVNNLISLEHLKHMNIYVIIVAKNILQNIREKVKNLFVNENVIVLIQKKIQNLLFH
jgi:hypothetical protein